MGLRLPFRGVWGHASTGIFDSIWWHLRLSNRHSITLQTELSVNFCSGFILQIRIYIYTEVVASMVATPMDTVNEQVLHVHDLHIADAV